MSTQGIPPEFFIENNGPIMTAGMWSMTTLALLFLAARIFAKVTRTKGLWHDDWILIASWIFLLAGTSLTQRAITLGYGRHLVAIDLNNILPIAELGQIAITIAVFANGLSKISFGVTLLRLVHGWIKVLVWFTIITLILVGIPSIILPWVLCSPTSKAFDDRIPGKCFPKAILIDYGIFAAAWTAFMDFVLALVPWALLWNLQMKTTEKIGVGIAMSLGLLSGTTAIVKGVYIAKLADPQTTDDFSFNGVNVTIWVTTETTAAIIAASIPVLRVFIRDIKNASYGSGSKGASKYGLGSQHNTNRNPTDIQLSKMARVSKSLSDAESAYIRRLKAGNSAWVSTQVRGDGESDKSILRSDDEEMVLPRHMQQGDGSPGVPQGQILQTNTVKIDYHQASEAELPIARSMSRSSSTRGP